jgi:Tat protein translocase TatB subunit
MFGIGTAELIVIFVIGLIVLGPNKFPGMVKSLTKGIREFRRSLLENEDEPEKKNDDTHLS